MSDKELLELAAKEAGITIKGYYADGHAFCKDGMDWNPLTDDGDALRLAVKLNIAICFPMDKGKFSSITAGQVGSPNVGCHELFNPDPCAATRRAIVRAAAEIGRTK